MFVLDAQAVIQANLKACSGTYLAIFRSHFPTAHDKQLAWVADLTPRVLAHDAAMTVEG